MLDALFNIISLQEKFAKINPADLNCYCFLSLYRACIYMKTAQGLYDSSGRAGGLFGTL